MEVSRIRQVCKIKLLERQFRDRSRIGHHVSPMLALQNYSNPCLCWALGATHPRNIYPTLLQRLDCKLSKIVVPNAGLKSYAASQRSEIVRQNRGRSAQSQHHAVGKQFALAWELFRNCLLYTSRCV